MVLPSALDSFWQELKDFLERGREREGKKRVQIPALGFQASSRVIFFNTPSVFLSPHTESRPKLHRQLLYVISTGMKQLSLSARGDFLHLLR